jgi:hypothetical protein
MSTRANHHLHQSNPFGLALTARLFTGLLALVMSAYAIFIGYQIQQRYLYPHNFHHKIDSPILAIELSRTAEDLEGVVKTTTPASSDPVCRPKGLFALRCPGGKSPEGDPGVAIAAIRVNTYKDFLFIVLYNLFLWRFAALFAERADGRRMIHRWIMLVLVILIAIFDCLENRGILNALKASELNDEMARLISTPSLCKWGLFAAALLLTGWILVLSGSSVYSLPTRRLLALAYGASALLMLVGSAVPHVIELAIEVFGLLVAVNIVGLLGPSFERWFFRPNPPKYVEDFCKRKAQKEVDVAIYPQNP